MVLVELQHLGSRVEPYQTPISRRFHMLLHPDDDLDYILDGQGKNFHPCPQSHQTRQVGVFAGFQNQPVHTSRQNRYHLTTVVLFLELIFVYSVQCFSER